MPVSSLPSLYDFFAPAGVLSHAHPQYEFRRGQLEMASAVEQALTERRHLIVEAGTGTGKTLAYLLPALRLGQRVIVSTGTKNLQEQIFYKDVPFLESLLGPLNVCYMKGRANYLCRRKLYALRDQPLLNGLEEIEHFRILSEWEPRTENGDRSEVRGLPENSPLWNKLDARSEACLGKTCPDWERCFITQMRRRALDSDLIIVNHHLYFADQAVKNEAGGSVDAGVLPEAAAVIFDEAHELEEVASAYFGVGLSNLRFEELARDTESLLRSKHVFSSAIQSATELVRDRSRMFFAALPPGDGRMPFTNRDEFLESDGDSYLGLSNALTRLEAELGRVSEADEATGLRNRAQEIRNQLRFLLESKDPNIVFWLERRLAGGLRNLVNPDQPNRHTFLQATPIDVAEILARTLFEQVPSVILTSATLSVQGGFQHLERRLGLEHARELIVPSHFRYADQVLLYLPPEMPDPREPIYQAESAKRILRILNITKGRAFCLFTSYQAMRDAYDRLISQTGYPLLLQGTSSRKALLEEFRETPHAVLLGTSSFWQGVDVQGEQLSCVIIDRLPFAVPSDPIVAARMRALEAEGVNPFMEYQVPQAVLTLKQGFGRLIRSLEDRGLLVLLDPRIQRQRYGKIFFESLPPYRVTQDIGEVESFFAST